MELDNERTPVKVVQRKSGRGSRQRGLLPLVLASALLAACSSEPEVTTLELGEVIEGFVGGVAADEPRAALVAQDVLAAGGTAADASVALAFSMAVTYPSAASLGGGGACVIYDAATQTSETISFLPGRPARGGIVAVPGTVRGMAALHSRYGRIGWADLVSPAEILARRGHSVSRALAGPLVAARPLLAAEQGLRSIFMTPSGKVLTEGDTLSQVPLSAVLAQIRVRGPGELYIGPAALNFVSGARALGGVVELADLRGYRPSWHDTISMNTGKFVYHTSPGPMTGGAIAGQMWAMLNENQRLAKAKGAQRTHLLAEVSARAYGDRRVNAKRPLSSFRAHALMTGYLPNRHPPMPNSHQPALSPELGEGGSTGFAVVDREGSAVACTLSMGRVFGAGRADRLTGIVFAAPPIQSDFEFLGPALVIGPEGRVIMAAAASGGPAAPAALVQGALVGVENGTLNNVLGAPRVFHPSNPDLAYVEPDMHGDIVANMRRRGHTLRMAPSLGRVNAILCPGGLGGDNAKCEYRSDQRGYGLAVGGEF